MLCRFILSVLGFHPINKSLQPYPYRQLKVGRLAFKVALIYVIVAGCWILFSDRLMAMLISDPEKRIHFSIIKGWSFVLATGILLYAILRHWQKQLQRGGEQREESAENLRRSKRALRTISNCNQVLVRASTEAELLSKICRVIVEKSGYRLAWVGFAENDEPRSVRVAAHSGHNNGFLEQVHLTWADTELGGGPTGITLRSGQIAFCNDYQTDPKVAPWRTEAKRHGYASSISLPLRNEEKTFGVLSLYTAETNAFSSAEIQLLTELADDLAYGIQALRTRSEHQQAEEKLRRSERALRTISHCNQVLVHARTEAELLSEICRVAVEKSGYRMAWVGFAENDEKKSIRIAASNGNNEGYLEQLQLTWTDTELGCGPTGAALRTGQVVFSNDYRTDPKVAFWRLAALQRGYASLIALPLRNGENTLGVLTLYTAETNAFSSPEIELLTELAGDLAYGIEVLRTRQEYRQAEEKVRILSRAMEQSPSAVIITNVAGTAEYVNAAFTRVTGYTLEEETGKSQRELLSGSQSSENHEKLWGAITAGRPWRGELQNRRKNGELFWEQKSVSPLLDQNGKVTHFLATMMDITAHKQAEETLRESEEKYRLLVENAQEAIYVVQQGIIQFANRKALDLSNQHEARLVVGRPILDFIPPEDQAAAKENHQQLLRSEIAESQRECRLRSGNDTPPRWLFVSAVRILWHGQPATLHFASDITARKQAEEALQQSQEKFKDLFENAPVGFHEINTEGRLARINKTELEMLGYSAEELTGQFAWKISAEEEATRQVVLTKLAGQPAPMTLERKFRRKDGTIFPVLITDRILKRADGTIIGTRTAIQDITERKQTVEALRQSQEEFQDLFENAPVGFHEIDTEGRLVRINKTELKMLGYSAARELLGKFVWTNTTEEEISRQATLTKLAGTPAPLDFERKFRRKDGSIFPVLINDRLLRREDGTIVGIRTAVQDITERKQAEEALRESEQKFSKMFHASPIAILLTTIKEGRFLDANEECLRMLGRTREEVIGHTVFEFNAWVDPEKRAAIISKLKELGPIYNLEMEFRSRSGQICHALGSVEELVIGGESCLLGLGLDITERKQAEAANTRLVTAVEQVADTVVITDTKGTILYANPSFEKTTGYTRHEALGQNPRFLKSGSQDAGFYRQMWETLVRGETWSGHFINKRKDGTEFEEDATISPIRDKQGTIINYVAVKHDVTHELQLEAQFRQAQKMEAVGQLAGGIAHDFNNILTSMFGYGYLLQQDLAKNPSALENTMEILKAAKRAQDLVQQILTFSRQRENKRQIIQLKIIIEEAMKFLRASFPANIKIEMNLADNLPTVLADPTQIYQVTINLATNALHAMEDRPGRLAVNLDSFQPGLAFIQTHPKFRPIPYVRLTVTDTGHGMDAKTLEHIFEPFFTTKPVGKGTGLGLAVVHGVVQSHNGIITVESQPGQGATFFLYFPAQANDAVETGMKNSIIIQGRGERVLLVDDEIALTTLFQRLLKTLNYQAFISNRPSEAAALFRKNPDQYDLVITDLTMPEMNGLELAHEIHALRPQLPVILLSGFSAAFTRETLREAGIRMLLNKPVSLSTLANALHNILAKP
jgi:PAS domain S-box-containing protein